MRILTWATTLVLTILCVVFVISNTQQIAFNLWPFELSLLGPAWLLAMAPLGFGFLVGAFIVWLTYGALRATARRNARRVTYLEGEVETLQERAESAEKHLAALDENAKAPKSSGVLLPPTRRYGALNLGAAEPGAPPMVGAEPAASARAR
ncbi:MAG: lipopolysaccharide assembly protein LapA domain-containing protein [Pseudomonadota bacterium]